MSDWLDGAGVDVLACGPSRWARQTLEPLSKALGQRIVVDERLGKSADPEAALAVLRELDPATAVVCVGRPLIDAWLRSTLAPDSPNLEVRCQRGAAWAIDRRTATATYYSRADIAQAAAGPHVEFVAKQLRAPGRKPATRKRLAVLDMGSTSFHLVVAERTEEGGLRRLARKRVMLRMGSELARSAEISPGLIERCVETVVELSAFAKAKKAEQLVAVATAALREASNGPEALEQIEAALGAPVQLLTGEQEAQVVYRAIRGRMHLTDEAHLGLDLGGGSLEVVVGRGQKVLFEKSLPLGVARMHGWIEPSDPHSKADLRKLREKISQELTPYLDAIRETAPGSCIAVGGTAQALGRVLLRDRGDERAELGGLQVTRKALARLAKELAGATHEERLERPGVSARRADLLPLGAETFVTVLSLLGLPSLTICDWGLREGVLLEWMDSAGVSTGAPATVE